MKPTCQTCGAVIDATIIDYKNESSPFVYAPPYHRFDPCGCVDAVAVFNFTPPERIEQMTKGPGELR